MFSWWTLVITGYRYSNLYVKEDLLNYGYGLITSRSKKGGLVMFRGVMKVMVLMAVVSLIAGSAMAQTKYVIGVDGMSCPFCAYGLEKKLKKVKDVVSVTIDLNEGQVVVVAKAGTTIKQEVLRKAVKEAGFTVSSLEDVARNDQ